jgi:hypothetical protein
LRVPQAVRVVASGAHGLRASRAGAPALAAPRLASRSQSAHAMSNLKRIEKNEVVALKNHLQELRDDIRVRIHLGGMELRDAFENLEREADRLVNRVPPAAMHALNDLAVRLRRVAHALDGKTG